MAEHDVTGTIQKGHITVCKALPCTAISKENIFSLPPAEREKQTLGICSFSIVLADKPFVSTRTHHSSSPLTQVFIIYWINALLRWVKDKSINF